jgi:pyruvate dehydrogenase E2 component (dihydrolipoamide acetyltransferase)
MALVEVKVPDIGDFKDVEVIELLVKPGDRVTAEQSLVTVESDKASMEIPSSHAGVVKEMRIKLGDKVSEGSALLQLEVEGEGPGVVAGAGAPPSKQAPSELAEAPSPSALAAAAAAGPPPPSPSPAAGAASAAPSGASSAGGSVEVVVPDIGDFADVAVIEVMVKPGDRIEAEQSLVTVESDKASMEIPSSHAGVVKELRVKVGDKVSKGSPVVLLETTGGAAAGAPAAAAASAPAPAAGSAPAPSPAAPPPAGQSASP